MKKNLYYRTVFQRRNTLQESFLNFFLAFCSWPRMLLEVFIRRNQGERYFSFSGAIVLAIVMAVLPVFFVDALNRLRGTSNVFMGMFATWYLYLIAFVMMAYRRREEIRRMPSVFDFGRFSLSTGEIHPVFFKKLIDGKPTDIRTIETSREPAPFFALGFLLWMAFQPIGVVLMIGSVFYALSYRAAYLKGDHFIMDKIDEMISNEETVKSFIDGAGPDETRGFRVYGRGPADPEVRRQLVDTFFEEEEVAEAM